MSIHFVLCKLVYRIQLSLAHTLATVVRFLVAIKYNQTTFVRRAIFLGRFSTFISLYGMSVYFRPPLFQPFHMVFIATVKIKWQNDDDGPYFVHYRAPLHSFFSPSFLPSLLRFAFLALAFILSPLSSLPLFFSFSSVRRIVRNSSGERDRGARFLSPTFSTLIFVLHANSRPDKA